MGATPTTGNDHFQHYVDPFEIVKKDDGDELSCTMSFAGTSKISKDYLVGCWTVICGGKSKVDQTMAMRFCSHIARSLREMAIDTLDTEQISPDLVGGNNLRNAIRSMFSESDMEALPSKVYNHVKHPSVDSLNILDAMRLTNVEWIWLLHELGVDIPSTDEIIALLTRVSKTTDSTPTTRKAAGDKYLNDLQLN